MIESFIGNIFFVCLFFLTDQEENYLSDCEQPIWFRIYETFNMVGM